MFDTLLGSPTTGAPWNRAIMAALLLHGLLIAAAVSSTSSPQAGTRPVTRDTIRIEMAEVRPLPESEDSPRSRPEAVIPEAPPVPDIALNAPEFQLPYLSFVPPGRHDSIPPSLLRSSGEPRVARDSTRSVFSALEVDELPELVEELHPRYPDQLRRAGVSGQVQVQYVVGSDGRVDQRSVRVLHSSHPAFLLAAVEALRKSRFKPARRGGRPTAVLVQQTIRFSYR